MSGANPRAAAQRSRWARHRGHPAIHRWESTALYYRLANERVRERRGGLASADLLVRSVDFASIRRLQVEQRWDEAGLVLLDEARKLQAAGAELVVLRTNYMHKVAPVIEAGLGVPLLHIADVAARAALATGSRRVGLTGVAATMAERFSVDRLARHGLDVVVPDGVDRERLDRAVFTELCRGVLSEPVVRSPWTPTGPVRLVTDTLRALVGAGTPSLART